MNAFPHTPNEERYLWLKHAKTRNRGSAPFVMNPNRSRLFAIAEYKQEELDIAIDADIMDNKMHELHLENYLVENGLFIGHPTCQNEIYCETLMFEAAKLLGWTQDRINKVDEFYKS